MRKSGELLRRLYPPQAASTAFGIFDAENGCGIPLECRSFCCSRLSGGPLSGDCPAGNSPH